MHDYEFTVSIPIFTSTASKPTETAAIKPKSNENFDWMDTDESGAPEAPAKVAKPVAVVPASTSSSHGNKPICMYGEACYRTNPAHFQQYAHPHLEGNAKPSAASSSAPAPAISKAETTSTSISKAVVDSSILVKKQELPIVTKQELPEKTPSPVLISPPTAAAPLSTSSTSTSAKRPMPAHDLMDDEESFLPKPKKPKLSAVSVSFPSASSKGNLMDWMDDEIVNSEPSTESKPVVSHPIEIRPSEPSNPVNSTDSKNTIVSSRPSSSQTTTATSTVQSVAEKEAEQNLKRPAAVQAPLRPTQDSISAAQMNGGAKALSCKKLSGWEAMEKEVKASRVSSDLSLALVFPSLGRGFNVQESVDLLLEAFEKYVLWSKSGEKVRLWFWPETPVVAAAFRRRMIASAGGCSSSSSSPSWSTSSSHPTDKPSGGSSGPISSLITMMPPGSSLSEQLPLIANVVDRVVIVNESNWRFKGIGAANSFNVQLNKLYSSSSSSSSKSPVPSLMSDTKALYSIGSEGCAYPVPVSPYSALLLKTNQTLVSSHFIIQLIVESHSSTQSSAIDSTSLRDAIISAFACLVAL